LPVYNTCKLVFIHVPKTGGTSIRAALDAAVGEGAEWNTSGIWSALLASPRRDELFRVFKRFFPLKSPLLVAHQHLPACLIREFVSTEVWETYYKFAMVRNPWDYAVSMYHFLRQALPNEQGFLNRQHPDLAYLVRQCTTFEDWVRLMPMFEPDMTSFFTDDDGNDIVDYVARYENLEEDFARLCERVGINAQLPRLNTSSREAYRDYYTAETKILVARHFSRDIERFDYSF
jgi:Sulfotransferase family